MASTSSFRASSSSSSTPSIPRTSTYDVFLSFRGEDTRYNFTDHLYSALGRRGIRTFRDDKLRRGEAIAPELLKAIEESRSSVIVFSENYARSRWCLDELVKIMECHKDLGHAVFPIFYHVDPSHVRKQEGSFGEAFAGYEENWKDKIPRWRAALTEAANLSGWHLLDGYESNQIKEITDSIFRRLKCKRLDAGANLVGIDSRVKEMILRLHIESSDVRIVGIYGLGGIDNKIRMHDLIQRMGWEIVREEFPDKPNKWSRLWDPHDIERALTTCEGIKEVETINLDLSKLKRVCFNSNVFSKMTSLRLLKVHSNVNLDQDFFYDSEEGRSWLYKLEGMLLNRNSDNEVEWAYDSVMKIASKMQLGVDFEIPSHQLRYLYWDGYPLDSLPSNFVGKNLVELHLKCSNIKQLRENEVRYLKMLKVIDLSYSKELVQMPEFSSLSNLERLILNGCVSLIDIDPSVGDLKKLTTLNLRLCHNLKGLPSSISKLESLEFLDLSKCSSFCNWDLYPCGLSNLEKCLVNQRNMRSLRLLYLCKTAIKELPSSIELESVEILDLSNFFEFEKFSEKGAKMKSLRRLVLTNTAIKELPTGIANWESLPTLDLSKCSKFEKFPEIQGNMRSLKKLLLKNTAIKDLPDSIGDLESLVSLDLSDCSKFEKFPEKGGNMKSLTELSLKNTAIKDLPDSIGDLEALEFLDLSDCSKFEKFPEKGGNMKSLIVLSLQNTAIKDLPDSIGDLESLLSLDLSDCSKFEKFPEKGGNMKSLKWLYLKNTAIKDLPTNISRLKNLERLILGGCSDQWEGLISNQLCNLQKLNISQCKMAGRILVLPSSLKEIDAYHCTSKEDLSGLLWLCHLNWLKSTTEELKCWKLGAVIPESNGIPEWIRYQNMGSEVTTELPTNWSEFIWYQNMGSEVTTELPTNWYEDPDFLGFVVSCVSRHIPRSDFDYCYLDLECELNLHGNGFEFKDKFCHTCCCGVHGNFKDLRDQVWVWWYPKIAIPKEHHHKYTHINASFWGADLDIKKCGINLIFAGDQQNHMPMLEHPQNSGDNGSALQDTDSNVHGANQDDEHYHIPILLDLLGNFGDIGSVILEGTDGNRKRRRDDSLPDVVEEPHYKRLGAPNTHLSL